MKVALIFTGKTTKKFVKEGVNYYIERIGKYTALEVVSLPDIKNTRNMQVREKKAREGLKIGHSLRSDDYVVVLDEKGSEYSTSEFSGLFGKMLMMPRKRLVFVIGGPWGFADEIYRRADLRLSLSRMTFSHQIVRLLFLEQLYRVFTVINGDPYHHD